MGSGSKSYELAWANAAESIAAKNFRGLLVDCPKCNAQGIPVSKWIKGPSKKPLYVCHTNGNGYFKACLLDGEQAADVRASVRLRREDVIKTLRMGKPYVLFSGGKDSLCLLHYISKLARSINKKITALHVDTTAGFPEVEDYVKQVCKKLKVTLNVVGPKHNYFEIAKKWGIPGVKSRWCCATLKIAPIRRFLSEIEEKVVVFDGIRAAESNIRATYMPIWYHPSFRCISVSPIFSWSDKKLFEYIDKYKLPESPAEKLNTSAECWCGAYKGRSDFEALLNIHPEIFDKLIEVEKAQKGKYTYLFENGVRVPLSTLKKK